MRGPVLGIVALLAVALAGVAGWLLLTPNEVAPAEGGVGVVGREGGEVVLPDAPGMPGSDTGTDSAGEPAALDVPERRATPMAQEAVVVGAVTGEEDGAAVAGVVVRTVWPPGGGERPAVQQSTTDANGHYRLGFERDTEMWGLEVLAGPETAYAFHRTSSGVDLGEELVLDLTVSRGAVFAGEVVDERGAAVAGASVRGWSQSVIALDGAGAARGGASDPGKTVQTDAGGQFRIGGLGPDFVLSAEARGMASHERRHGSVAAGTVVEPVTLVVSAAREIRGLVVVGNEQPVPGVPVRTITDPGGTPGTARAGVFRRAPAPVRAVTDERGAFVLAGLSNQPVDVIVESPDHPRWTGEHRPGQAGMLVRLSEGVTVAGRVLDSSGVGLAGAEVAWAHDPLAAINTGGRRAVRTGADGGFRITGVRATNTGVLAVRADGHAVAVRQPAVAEMDAPPFELVLSRERVLGGVVVDQQGVPVADAQVLIEGDRVLALDGAMFPIPTWERIFGLDQVVADARGRFLLDELYDGEFTVVAIHPDDGSRSVKQTVRSASPELRLVFGSEGGRGVVLTGVARDGLTGAPVMPFTVTPMIPQDGGGMAGSGQRFEHEDGSFRMAGLGPGPMMVQVEAVGYSTWRAALTDYVQGEHMLDVVLLPTRQLHLRVVDEVGAPLSAQVSFTRVDDGSPLNVSMGPGMSATIVSTDTGGEVVCAGLPATRVNALVDVSTTGGRGRFDFDLTFQELGVRTVVVPTPETVTTLVVVVGSNGPVPWRSHPGDAASRLLEVAQFLASGVVHALPGASGTVVTVRRSDGSIYGRAELDAESTASVLPDGSPADPIAVHLAIPTEPLTLEVTAEGYRTATAPWTPPAQGEDGGMVVIALERG